MTETELNEIGLNGRSKWSCPLCPSAVIASEQPVCLNHKRPMVEMGSGNDE